MNFFNESVNDPEASASGQTTTAPASGAAAASLALDVRVAEAHLEGISVDWRSPALWFRPSPHRYAPLRGALPDSIRTTILQVLVRDNNVDQALRVLKKKMQREGVFREMKRRAEYEKPSERRAREHADAIRRARKLARKQAQREGLLPPPKPRDVRNKPRPAGAPAPVAAASGGFSQG